jgi:hypothetical protein
MSEPFFPGAAPDREAAVFNVKAYGAAGNGRADDTRAIRRAAEALSAVGGGTLLFPAGTYRVFGTSEFQDLAIFQHLDGVRLEGTGATLVIDPSRGTDMGRVFNFAFCRNVTLDGFRVRGPVTTFLGGQVTGFAFCTLNAGCSGFTLPRNEVQGCMLGLVVKRDPADPAQPPCRGIQVGTLSVRDCWYGINCQNAGDDLTVSLLETDHVFRSYYIYGVHNHRVSVRSRNVQGDDVLLWSWGGRGCEDIYVKYVNRGNGATDNPVFARDASFNAATNHKITIGWSGPKPGTHRNIHLDVNVDYTGGGRHAGSSLLHIDKRREGGAPETEDVGHVLENLTLTGTVRGTPSTPAGGLIYTAPAARWGERVAPGGRRDRWTNFVFQNTSVRL